jgi:hypothetical protein
MTHVSLRDEIAQRFSDKTIDIIGHRETGDVPMTLLFRPDGSVVSQRAGRADITGHWRIDERGLHCTQWETNRETCAQIVENPDGTYLRVHEGKVRATWRRVR